MSQTETQHTQIPRPKFPKRAIITGGMPYGNKELHFGHIGGVFIHADILARFLRDRIGTENVIFVSGTDCYGSPIVEYHRNKVEKGEFAGSLEEFVMKNHHHQKQTLEKYAISLNLFGTSAFGRSGEIHTEISAYFFHTLRKNGHLQKMDSLQFFDSTQDCFLNGRQVIGQCPIDGCQSEKAYADECALGHQYQPQELLRPISTLSNTKPILKGIENWYIPPASVNSALQEWVQYLEEQRKIRKFALSDIQEFFGPIVSHVHNKHAETLASIKEQLPPHQEQEGKGKSTQLIFSTLEDREKASSILSENGIQYRNGKTLVPFRLTGNLEWGVPVPEHPDLRFWVWPESLWAPISFTSTYLESIGQSKDSWKDWWCTADTEVYQFIGEDNVYFYGPAQSAMFCGMQGANPTGRPVEGELQPTELIVNKHLLFLQTKASSSGNVKPPMAADLLEQYTAEQLRAHFISLGLGMKNISFAPKSYNPDAKETDADPVLKEAQLLSNVFNRLVRNGFYTVQKCCNNQIPVGTPSLSVIEECNQSILAYERSMHSKNLHQTFGTAEKLIRNANKVWSSQTKDIDWNDPGASITQPLVDLFHYIRVSLLLMHPITPIGTENIIDKLGLSKQFWNWEFAFDTIYKFMEDPTTHTITEIPPKTDFF